MSPKVAIHSTAAILAVLFLLAACPASSDDTAPLLAQYEEGDLDQSFEAYGQDVDEILEPDEALTMPVDSLIKGIRWLGHASFLIQDSLDIYIDPYDLPEDLIKSLPPADLILVTHDHSDHFSPDDIKKILTAKTMVISIAAVKDGLPEEVKHFGVVAPGDTIQYENLKIIAVPAYNIGKDFHPKAKGYVGYVVHLPGRVLYHAGDTDLIPEMTGLKVDIALLPVGGRFTMDAEEAARAANVIKPRVAIPMHWGKIIGSLKDAQRFQAGCGMPVVILTNEAAEGGTADR